MTRMPALLTGGSLSLVLLVAAAPGLAGCSRQCVGGAADGVSSGPHPPEAALRALSGAHTPEGALRAFLHPPPPHVPRTGWHRSASAPGQVTFSSGGATVTVDRFPGGIWVADAYQVCYG